MVQRVVCQQARMKWLHLVHTPSLPQTKSYICSPAPLKSDCTNLVIIFIITIFIFIISSFHHFIISSFHHFIIISSFHHFIISSFHHHQQQPVATVMNPKISLILLSVSHGDTPANTRQWKRNFRSAQIWNALL